MNKKLRFNICHLPSSFLKDIEIQDIKSRIQACIDEDLQYSCNFWGFHLEKSNFSKEISNNLELFLNEKGLFWIEAMNIMGVISRGQPDRNTYLGMRKYHKLLSHFMQLGSTFSMSEVKESTPHLYLSILPFWADVIPIAQNFRKLMKVLHKSTTAKIACLKVNSSVLSVAISPDGKRIVSGSCDSTVRIWDAETGSSVGQPLQGHDDSVLSIEFSPDGKRIVSGSHDRTVRIWDVETGSPVGQPQQGHDDSVQSVGFSPDGKRIVSGSDDRTVRIWDA
ncbi:WD40 repeat-like protein, partial [Dendrothele bispora CBS 962.96]